MISKFALVVMAGLLMSLTGCATIASDWNNSPVSVGSCYNSYSGCQEQRGYNSYTTTTFYGNVVAIEPTRVVQRSSNASGGIIGAIAGGLIGNTMGHKSGRKWATAAGVVAGGVTGNALSNRETVYTSYDVVIRLDSGYIFRYGMPNSYLRVGDRVTVTSDGRSANIARIDGNQNGNNPYEQRNQQYQQNGNNPYEQRNQQYQQNTYRQDNYGYQNQRQTGNNPFNQR